MKNGIKTAKILVLAICAILYNAASAFSEDNVSTTVYQNGQEIEKTKGYATSVDNNASASGSDIQIPEPSAAQKQKDEEAQKEAADTEYSNLYHKRPLFPIEMMIYCKVNAEDIAEDLSLIDECIKKYVKEINNSNKSISEHGIKEYDKTVYQAYADALTNSTDKLKSIINYEETQNSYANAANMSTTQRDTEAALANTNSFSTDVINNLRSLYAQLLQMRAIEGIRNIDPAAILSEVEYVTSKTEVKESASTTFEAKGYKAKTEIKAEGSAQQQGDVDGTPAEEGQISTDKADNLGEGDEPAKNGE